MIFNNIKLNPYTLKLKKPLINSSKTYKQINGYMIRLYLDEVCGCGDIVILPSFSKVTYKEVEWAFEELKLSLMIGASYNKEELISLFEIYASKISELHFALDTALYDILSSSKSVGLYKYLNPSSNKIVRFSSLHLGHNNKTSTNRVKIKLGCGVEKDINLLDDITSQYDEGVYFRLDFNGAYGVEEAIRCCGKLAKYNIEYIEEPFNNIDQRRLNFFKDQISIPIAIDETLIRNDYHDLIKNNLIEYVVLKPSLFGGFDKIFKLHKLIKKHNVKLILSSSLENIIGNLSCIHLAAGMNEIGPHGINNQIFYNYKFKPLNYNNEAIELKNIIGLGACWDDC